MTFYMNFCIPHTQLNSFMTTVPLCVNSFPPEPTGEAAQASSDGDQTPDKNKKKNRCFSCRKKVGLTGKEENNFMEHTGGNTELFIATCKVQRFVSNKPQLLQFHTIDLTITSLIFLQNSFENNHFNFRVLKKIKDL